jgi:hypothetical protein
MPQTRAAACLMLPLAAVACHLIDQRDFDRSAGQRPVPAQIAAASKPEPALVTIRYSVPDPPYREALAQLVQQALARKRDVLFTVTTLVPGAQGADAQALAAEQAAETGREVAQAIADDGAEPGQIEQTVRIDPSIPVREVRVQLH